MRFCKTGVCCPKRGQDTCVFGTLSAASETVIRPVLMWIISKLHATTVSRFCFSIQVLWKKYMLMREYLICALIWLVGWPNRAPVYFTLGILIETDT